MWIFEAIQQDLEMTYLDFLCLLFANERIELCSYTTWNFSWLSPLNRDRKFFPHYFSLLKLSVSYNPESKRSYCAFKTVTKSLDQNNYDQLPTDSRKSDL